MIHESYLKGPHDSNIDHGWTREFMKLRTLKGKTTGNLQYSRTVRYMIIVRGRFKE